MRTKNNNTQEFDLPFQRESRIRATPRTSIEYTIYLDDEISSPSSYRDETQILLNATQQDDISLIINSPGGRLDTAQQLIEAIKYSAANVTAVIAGDCASAATMIALSCPHVLVLDSAEFMVHTASYYSGGVSPRIKSHVDFTHSQINKMIDEYYSGFLTKKEIEQVKTGTEFWFDASQIRERFQNRIKYLKSVKEKSTKNTKKPIKPEEVQTEEN